MSAFKEKIVPYLKTLDARLQLWSARVTRRMETWLESMKWQTSTRNTSPWCLADRHSSISQKVSAYYLWEEGERIRFVLLDLSSSAGTWSKQEIILETKIFTADNGFLGSIIPLQITSAIRPSILTVGSLSTPIVSRGHLLYVLFLGGTCYMFCFSGALVIYAKIFEKQPSTKSIAPRSKPTSCWRS